MNLASSPTNILRANSAELIQHVSNNVALVGYAVVSARSKKSPTTGEVVKICLRCDRGWKSYTTNKNRRHTGGPW